ncbi:hypothetical protein D7X94_00240 [Acutalibacter sp. 1XD8-33]|uniref:hypothetical protein n=1 Tax=Acutalibacter sp. 1XD8-33 TaxID=2320081 RepID=UPI000EA09B46|nr:hypothetical protein [Acutalibacter sp. 1XD8-33]RKJ41948.1 hypothetical protein D7X94_00240 [Acutalibacter sp. 1XD8-33]
MNIKEIIDSLLDQAQDRESMIPADEPDSIFAHDMAALQEAAKIIEAAQETNNAIVLLPDRWEPCVSCVSKTCGTCFWGVTFKNETECKHCTGHSQWTPAHPYCENCGRPLTESAFADLKERIQKMGGDAYD